MKNWINKLSIIAVGALMFACGPEDPEKYSYTYTPANVSVDKSTLTFEANPAGTQAITVGTADGVPYVIYFTYPKDKPKDWLSVDKQYGQGAGNLVTVTAKPNDGGEAREGTLEVWSTKTEGVQELLSSVKITQGFFAAGDVLTDWTFSMTSSVGTLTDGTLMLDYTDGDKITFNVAYKDSTTIKVKLANWGDDDKAVWNDVDKANTTKDTSLIDHTVELSLKDGEYRGKDGYKNVLVVQDKDDHIIARVPIQVKKHPGFIAVPADIDTVWVNKAGTIIQPPSLKEWKLTAYSIAADAEWTPSVVDSVIVLKTVPMDALEHAGDIVSFKGEGPFVIEKILENKTGATREKVITLTVDAKFLTDHPDFMQGTMSIRVIQLAEF